MEIIAVSVPGPWWTRLSYLHDTILEPGVRVLVPLGRGVRVGIVVTADGTEAPSVKLKPILEVLDSRPPLPADIAKTLNWFAETWFVGMGLAAKTLLPSKFLEKESLTTLTEKNVSHGGSSVATYMRRVIPVVLNATWILPAVFPGVRSFFFRKFLQLRGFGVYYQKRAKVMARFGLLPIRLNNGNCGRRPEKGL